MAITINQQPTYPNVSKTNLLYSVSSDSASNFQFQYVMDIVSGSTLLTRNKQYPNPAGAAIFDVSRIIDDYLEYRTDIFTTTQSEDFGSSQQTFSIRFGEEYGTSLTSIVTLYDGSGSEGAPIVSGSDAVVWPGTIDPNNGLGYNWDDVYTDNIFLTSYPNSQNKPKEVSVNDYSLLAYKGANITGSLSVEFFNSSNVSLGTLSLTGSKEPNGTYIPSGLKNYEPLVSQSIIDNTMYYTIDVGTVDKFYYKVKQECYWDRTHFAFINREGVWDFYGIDLPKTKNTNLTRDSITKPRVDYSSTLSPYKVNSRGMDYFNIKLEDTFTIITDYITQDVADWLSDMIESPSVFIQDGDKFIPIVITNATYRHNTNIRTQKLFTYTIEYMYSNQRMNR